MNGERCGAFLNRLLDSLTHPREAGLNPGLAWRAAMASPIVGSTRHGRSGWMLWALAAGARQRTTSAIAAPCPALLERLPPASRSDRPSPWKLPPPPKPQQQWTGSGSAETFGQMRRASCSLLPQPLPIACRPLAGGPAAGAEPRTASRNS